MKFLKLYFYNMFLVRKHMHELILRKTQSDFEIKITINNYVILSNIKFSLSVIVSSTVDS